MKNQRKKSRTQELRKSGPRWWGWSEGRGRRSGVYPVSGPHPAGDAEVRGQASWARGEPGAAGYEDHGSSELIYEGGQVLGGYSEEEQRVQQRRKKGGRRQLASPSFSHVGSIPGQFTCDGRDISPALFWTDGPKETKSFALIVHDPDTAGKGGFTHGIVYNIPANINSIAENAPHKAPTPRAGCKEETIRARWIDGDRSTFRYTPLFRSPICLADGTRTRTRCDLPGSNCRDAADH